MRRRRLFLATTLSIGLLGSLAGSANGAVIHYLNIIGNYTIYQTFTHTGTADCGDHPTWKYKVAMSATVSNPGNGSTFTVRDVTVTYTVTTGTTWAHYFFMHGSYQRWPASGEMSQRKDLYGGQSITYTYHPQKTFKKDATLENWSYFDVVGVPNSCRNVDQWVLYLY